MPQLPLISIITPSYNQGMFIAETMNSILSQGYPRLEYIVIDGGSTDDSVEKIRSQEPNLSYWVSEKDNGQADAVNKGFRRATGDIIGWINSDDMLTEGALHSIAEYFELHPDIDIVYGDLNIVNTAGTFLFCKKVTPYNFYAQLFSSSLVPQPSTFWRRNVFEKVGFLNERYQFQMDYEYFVRMGAAGLRFGTVNRPLASFRLHGNSKTMKDYSTMFFSMEFEIQRQYLPAGIQHPLILKFLKVIFKARTFLLRAVLRGDFVPFQNAYFRTRSDG
jgi:glycosyltransferase involved in cell wall biosynthesis